MIKGIVKRIFKVCIFLLLPLLAALSLVFVYLHHPIQPREAVMVVEKGMAFRTVTSHLAKRGIIEYPWFFFLYAHLRGETKYIKAGEYLFSQPVSPLDVLQRLVHGRVNAFKVQIIEGWTLHQIANYLAGLPFIKNPEFKKEFLELTENKDFIQSLEINSPTLEGYLFPNTYYLYADTPPADYLRNFVKEFQKNYQLATSTLKTIPVYSQNQIMTLASLIEKEAGVEGERSLVASVFYNRLAKGMSLQSDPTVVYGIKNFDGDIKKADLTNPHPYNTYIHAGLPPGPICNPGLASIKAALQPAQTNYIYFVSKGNGTHQFSETIQEHEEGVKRLLLKDLMTDQPAAPENQQK